MLNWFTFGVMFLTIGLLILTCFYLEFRKKSDDYTIDHLVNLQKHIIDELTEENKNLKVQLDFIGEQNKHIDKQQEVLKELKEKNAEQIEVITEWVNGERINDIKHISKDKIRERIKELEEKMKQDEVDEFGIHSIGWSGLDYVVEQLKELLEE